MYVSLALLVAAAKLEAENALGICGAGNRLINKLKQSIFFRYLWIDHRHKRIDRLIDIELLNRLINAIYCLPCFVVLVLLVATAKIHFEEQAVVVGTKQSSQANKADRLTSPAVRQEWLAQK